MTFSRFAVEVEKRADGKCWSAEYFERTSNFPHSGIRKWKAYVEEIGTITIETDSAERALAQLKTRISKRKD